MIHIRVDMGVYKKLAPKHPQNPCSVGVSEHFFVYAHEPQFCYACQHKTTSTLLHMPT